MQKAAYVLSVVFGVIAIPIAYVLTSELFLSIACGLLVASMLLTVFLIAQRRSEQKIQRVLEKLGCTVRYRCDGNLQAPGGVFYCVICLTDDGLVFLLEVRGTFQPEFLPKEQIVRYLVDETGTGLAVDTADNRRYVVGTAALKELFSQLQQMGWI